MARSPEEIIGRAAFIVADLTQARRLLRRLNRALGYPKPPQNVGIGPWPAVPTVTRTHQLPWSRTGAANALHAIPVDDLMRALNGRVIEDPDNPGVQITVTLPAEQTVDAVAWANAVDGTDQ